VIFIVVRVIIPVCLFTGIARPLIAGSHPAGRPPGTLTRPAGSSSAAGPRSGNT
jgi:hypothetical protein